MLVTQVGDGERYRVHRISAVPEVRETGRVAEGGRWISADRPELGENRTMEYGREETTITRNHSSKYLPATDLPTLRDERRENNV